MSSKKMIINYLVSGAKERNDTRRYHIAAERRWNAKKEIKKKTQHSTRRSPCWSFQFRAAEDLRCATKKLTHCQQLCIRLIDDDNDSGERKKERKKDFCEKGKLCSCTRCNFIQLKHFDCDLCDLCEAMMTFLSLSFRHFCCVVNVCSLATYDSSPHSTWRKNFISAPWISGRS